MSKTIILIRHGKAEAAQEGVSDEQRRLTTAGKRALAYSFGATLQPVAELLCHNSCVVLSSPYVRAKQTAKIVCTALALENLIPESCEVLASDDPKAIVNEARSREEDIVIMVGHIPSLEKAAQLLCGTRLALKPGAVALFDLIDEFNGADNLRWLVQGPVTERWERVQNIEAITSKLGKELGSAYRSFVDDPSDTSALDGLYTSLASLRAALLQLKPLLKRKAVTKTLDNLATLLNLCNPLYNLDLQAAAVNSLDLHAQERRQKKADKLLSDIASHAHQSAISNIRSCAKNLPWKSRIAENGIELDMLSEEILTLLQ